jgi:hypothetical protein
MCSWATFSTIRCSSVCENGPCPKSCSNTAAQTDSASSLVISMPLKRKLFYGLVGKAHGTYHVLKAGMHGSGINIVGEPQLFDAP